MKLYFEAEKFMVKSGDHGSVQNRIFNDSTLKNSPKHIFAVVISTLKYKDYIMKIIKNSRIKLSPIIKKLKVSDEMLCLLTHDLLFSSKGRIQLGKHAIKDAFLQHKTRLHSEFIKLKLKYKVTSVEDFPNVKGLDDETPVRWFRINRIKIDPSRFFAQHDFFSKLQPTGDVASLQPGMIYHDDHIPYLFGVHPREKIMDTPAYKAGEIIIQDRASCFPAHILFNDDKFQPHEVIDGCAAPGNKTTHIASYLHDLAATDPVVYAFERDNKRVETLKKMCLTATGTKQSKLIQITHQDFTKTNPNDFPNVTGLVMDPSCSGSGIFGRAIEDSLEQQQEEIDTERLQKLSRFQFTIMKHALKFPKASKVVYSTCSIHAEENERVVVDLLLDDDIKQLGWELAPQEIVIPSWPRRGWPSEFTALANNGKSVDELAGGCVRAKPKEDGGIGFFAACFIKKDHSNHVHSANKTRKHDDEEEQQQQEEEEEEEDEWTGFDN